MVQNQSRPLSSVGILGSPQGPYVRQLQAAAKKRNTNTRIELLSFSDLACSLNDSQLQVLTSSLDENSQPQSQINLLELDAVIVRTMPVGTLEQVIFRMDALQAVEAAGLPVLNPPRSLEIAIDKWLTLQRMARAGVPVPATIVCQTRGQAMEAFERLGKDVVVKPIFGGEGRGIIRVSDIDMAWRVFGSLQQLGNVLYVQQFLPNFGYDIRVLIVGSRWLCVKRFAQEGGWRTNISQGAHAQPHQLTDQQRHIAATAAASVGGSFLGVDLLPLRDGSTVVLEVNAVPGWKGTANALNVDVADMVIEHLESLHVQRS